MKISELPEELRAIALLRKKEQGEQMYTDDLSEAFSWENTKEGYAYWEKYNNKKLELTKEPKHYDNSNGSLYKFCEEQGLNTYEFDIIKRVMRCRKKGMFIEDLEKTKFLIDLYIKEMKEDEK
jgi:hypothetical protein